MHIAASIIVGCLQGCGAEGAADSADSAVAGNEPAGSPVESGGPLTRVADYKASNGSSLEIFETDPGELLAVQSAPLGRPQLVDPNTARLPVVEMFERVSGSAAPATLVQAAERQRQLGGEAEASTAEVEAAEAPPRQESVAKAFDDEQYFLDDICAGAAEAWTYRTGSGDFTWKNIHEAWSYVYAYRGDVELWARVRTRPIRWNEKVRKVVKEGSYDAIWRPSGTGKFDWNAGVDQADGDGYHFCSTR